MSYKMDAQHSERRLVTFGTGWAFTNHDNKRQGCFEKTFTKDKAELVNHAKYKSKIYNINTTNL
jgi:hypothetical protein